MGGGDGSLPGDAHSPAGSGSGRPLPWLALLVSSLGALFGLIVFAFLSKALADPAPDPTVVMARRRLRPMSQSGPGR
jgi:hypothetical protein